MKNITNTEELNERILILKERLKNEEKELKEQLKRVHESLRPQNSLLNTVKELVGESRTRDNVTTSLASAVAGYLSKRIAIGSTHNPVKILFGSILQASVVNIVQKNSGLIKVIGLGAMKAIFRKKEARS